MEDAMKIVRMLVVLLATAVSGIPARAQPPGSVVGTWRLVSFDREVLETKAVSHAFGGHAVGLLTYTSDGRMMAIIVDSMRKPPARPTPTDAEALGLYRSMLAYAGSYKVQGNKIINHVEISWNPTLTGTDQKRLFKLEGDRLTLTTPPLVSAFLKNQTTVSTLVWERVK
jgi:Lipocalin-like domain